MAGCAGNASATAKIAVSIVHTYIGDLVVELIAPDGSTYVLHNRAGGSADNINQTYTVNLSSEAANGTWRLRVRDAAAADTGYPNAWAISAAATRNDVNQLSPAQTAAETSASTATCSCPTCCRRR